MQRRQQDRQRVWFPVNLAGDGVDGMAVSHNVSAGGMLMALSARLEPGAPVTISIRLPPTSDAEHTIHGKVVRVEENTEDPEGMWPYRIAVSFDAVDAELVPFLEEVTSQLSQAEE